MFIKLKEQINEIKEVIELPLLKPELFKKIGIEPPKGILLYGPSGTGKTKLAKAVANSTNATFIEIVGSELVQKYIGEGAKTVLPSKAYAKISMRLVPNQSSEKITALFTKHFLSIAPKSVKVKVTPIHGGEPYGCSTDTLAYKAASKAMLTTFGKEPIPVCTGGSIPIVALFEKELSCKSLLMGFGLDSDAFHSPNEHFGIFNYLKGIETISLFYKYYCEAFKNK